MASYRSRAIRLALIYLGEIAIVDRIAESLLFVFSVVEGFSLHILGKLLDGCPKSSDGLL